MYTFLFDRRSMALFLTGAGIAGALLFGTGVLVGLRINLPAAPIRTAAFEALSQVRGELGGTQATGSAVPEDTPVSGDASVPAPEETQAPSAATEPTERNEPAKTEPPALIAQQATVVAKASNPAPTSSVRMPTRTAPTRVALRQEAAAAADKTPAAPSSARPRYWVQVGAYRVVENADRELARLLAEGFNAYVAPLRTSSGAVLQAVRFGGYGDRQAALDDKHRYIEGGAGREAFVRPPA